MTTYQAIIDIEANNLQQAIDAFYNEYGMGLEEYGIKFQEKGE